MDHPKAALTEPETYYAPALRASEAELRSAARACLTHPVARFLLDAVDGTILILDEHRQLLAASPGLESLQCPEEPAPFGLRPGELLGCIHVPEGPGGCGTSPACAQCGLVRTLLEAQASGRSCRGECLISMRRNGRLEAGEFQVTVSPLPVGPHRLLVVMLHDLSALKRREALEHLFFHDVANLIQGLRGWAEMLVEGATTAELAAGKLLQLTGILEREVRSHRELVQAEDGRLWPRCRRVLPMEILRDVRDLLDRHPACREHHVLLGSAEAAALWTDPDLLARVLLNMGVNAAEASPPGSAIRLEAREGPAGVRFTVQNPGLIPKDIQLRMFQRSFSTKAEKGRGLGTYAMKLFGENVLGGRVGFECGAGETTFFIELPVTDP